MSWVVLLVTCRGTKARIYSCVSVNTIRTAALSARLPAYVPHKLALVWGEDSLECHFCMQTLKQKNIKSSRKRKKTTTLKTTEGSSVEGTEYIGISGTVRKKGTLQLHKLPLLLF